VGGAPCTPSSRNRWREHEMCWTSAEFRAQANGTFGMMRLAFLHQKTSPPLHEEAVERQTGLVHNLINAAVDNRSPLPYRLWMIKPGSPSIVWFTVQLLPTARTQRHNTTRRHRTAPLPLVRPARTSSSIEDRRYADFLYCTHRTANNKQSGRVVVSVTPAATVNLKHQAH
jgi:hypothetical protein